MSIPMLDYGVANFVLPGQGESGDSHLVCCKKGGILVAAIDGVGHGQEAASAAKMSCSVLKESCDEQPIALVEKCHFALRGSRGVVLSLAFINPGQGLMTWLGVGNVQGALMRADAPKNEGTELLLLRGGLVGSKLPSLQATVLRIAKGDTLFFATDGIRGEFVDSLNSKENPQHAVDRILKNYRSGSDDALVLAARLLEGRQ